MLCLSHGIARNPELISESIERTQLRSDLAELLVQLRDLLDLSLGLGQLQLPGSHLRPELGDLGCKGKQFSSRELSPIEILALLRHLTHGVIAGLGYLIPGPSQRLACVPLLFERVLKRHALPIVRLGCVSEVVQQRRPFLVIFSAASV